MRIPAIVLLGSALLLLGVIASGEASGNSPAQPSAAAVLGGQLQCYGNETEGWSLVLYVDRNDGGGSIGVVSNGLSVFKALSGTCEEALAALAGAIPQAPLCVGSEARYPYPSQIICSGAANKVIGAFAELAKAVVALP